MKSAVPLKFSTDIFLWPDYREICMHKKYIIKQALRKTDEIRSKASQSCENVLITSFLKRQVALKIMFFFFNLVYVSVSLPLGVCMYPHTYT